MGTAFNQNLLFVTTQKRDRWASEATNLPTYLVRLVLKKLFARRLHISQFNTAGWEVFIAAHKAAPKGRIATGLGPRIRAADCLLLIIWPPTRHPHGGF